MAEPKFMNKIRQWDNQAARWIMRHFYFMFFQIILFILFIFWFVNTVHVSFNVADVNQYVQKPFLLEKLLATQSVNQTIIVILLLLNSFWMLYIFNILQRMITLLKDVNFTLMRIRNRDRS